MADAITRSRPNYALPDDSWTVELGEAVPAPHRWGESPDLRLQLAPRSCVPVLDRLVQQRAADA